MIYEDSRKYCILILNLDFRKLIWKCRQNYEITGFPDTERTPLLQGIVTESRQRATNVDHMSTFFTPVESPTHSDDEDISFPRKQGDSRKLSKSNELFRFLAKLTPDKVSEIMFSFPH